MDRHITTLQPACRLFTNHALIRIEPERENRSGVLSLDSCRPDSCSVALNYEGTMTGYERTVAESFLLSLTWMYCMGATSRDVGQIFLYSVG
jgi:hypothetical protein